MTIGKALKWQTVLVADDAQGEVAAAHASANVTRAAAEGDAAQSALWQATAEAWQTLHTINRHGTRRR